MGFEGVRRTQVHALRPHGHLYRQATIAVLAFCAPILAVLYWLTIPRGNWLPVLIGQLVIMLLATVSLIAAYRTVIWVDHTGVSERGFFGRITNVPAGRTASALMLDLYQSSALDTHPQLFVMGTDGRLLLRMRGQFWSTDDMETVVTQLTVPVERIAEPMTLGALNQLRPELLYWFERRPAEREGRAFEAD